MTMTKTELATLLALLGIVGSGPVVALASFLDLSWQYWAALVLMPLMGTAGFQLRRWGGAGKVTADRVVLVTGANRGIGYEVTKALALSGRFSVILTARDSEAGRQAEDTIKAFGGNVTFFSLDVQHEDSIKKAVQFVQDRFGRLDVLVNNAAISYSSGSRNLSQEARESMLDTNVHGMLRVADCFHSLLARNPGGNAHVINVGSRRGRLVLSSNPKLAEHIQELKPCRSSLLELCNEVVVGDERWPSADTYGVSKLLLHLASYLLAVECAKDHVLISSVCPGFVRTRMGGPMAPLTPEQGGQVIVKLIQDPPKASMSGWFWTEAGAQLEEKWG